MSVHEGVVVGVDATDHLFFFCPKCAGSMFVESVNTCQGDQLVTSIELLCDKCDTRDQRKVYWNAQVHTPNCWKTDGTKVAI
jgi:hypothetical protein